MEPAPPLKTDPKYGFYPWWPEDGDDWVHPEDVALARDLIPSPGGVFRRDGHTGPFVVLHYGDLKLRVKRTLWQEVAGEGFELGDWVEVLSRGQNTPRTGVIREIQWEPRSRSMRYQILEGDVPVPNMYSADDLRHVEPTQLS